MAALTETKVLKAHVSLNVSDLDKSVDFYRKMLDIEPMKVRPGYAKFDVENPPLNLSMSVHKPEQGGALSHMGLQVATTEDVLAIRDRWVAAGLKPHDEMQTACCYALQDKAWVSDPDGNQWEVFAVLANVEKNTTSCCSQDATAASDLVTIGNSCCG